MNFKHQLILVTGVLGYTDENGREWPDNHVFSACTDEWSGNGGDTEAWIQEDCLAMGWGNEYHGQGWCEDPYYVSWKFDQDLSDYFGDVYV